MKHRTISYSYLWIPVLLLRLLSLRGIAAQTACGNQYEPVAKACTADFVEGSTIYYDSALFVNNDCVCEFNTTSSSVQVSAFVQPPIDLCGSKIEISVGPDNPFIGQKESVTCRTETIVLETTLHNSGKINIQNVGSENLNSDFCLQFEADVGDLVSINCKPSMEVSTEEPDMRTTTTSTTTEIEETSVTTNMADPSNTTNMAVLSTTTKMADSSTTTKMVDSSTTTKMADSSTTTKMVDSSTATKMADSSTATSMLDSSTATNMADSSTATNMADSSTATNMADSSTATNMADSSTATNMADSSTATNMADSSTATNMADSSTATNMADSSTATNMADSTTTQMAWASTTNIVSDSSTTIKITEPSTVTTTTMSDSSTTTKIADTSTATEAAASSTTTQISVIEEFVPEIAINNITGVNEGISEMTDPSKTLEEKLKELSIMFPGAFQSTTGVPLLLEPFTNTDYLEYLSMEKRALEKSSERGTSSSSVNLSMSTNNDESTDLPSPTSVIIASSSIPIVDEVLPSSSVQHSSMTTTPSVLTMSSELSSSSTDESKLTASIPSLVTSESIISTMKIDSYVTVQTEIPIQPSEANQIIPTESFKELTTVPNSVSSIQNSMMSILSVREQKTISSDIIMSSSLNVNSATSDILPNSQRIESSYSLSNSLYSVSEVQETATSTFSENMVTSNNILSESAKNYQSSSYDEPQEMSSAKLSSFLMSDGVESSGFVNIYPDEISAGIENFKDSVSSTPVSEFSISSPSATTIVDEISTAVPQMSPKSFEDETSLAAFLNKNSILESKAFDLDGIESSSIHKTTVISSSTEQLNSAIESMHSLSPISKEMSESSSSSFVSSVQSAFDIESSSFLDSTVMSTIPSTYITPTKSQNEMLSSDIQGESQTLSKSITLSMPGLKERHSETSTENLMSKSSNLITSSASEQDVSSALEYQITSSSLVQSTVPIINSDSSSVMQLLSSEPVKIVSSNSVFSSFLSIQSESVTPSEVSLLVQPDVIQSSMYISSNGILSKDFVTQSNLISIEQESARLTGEIMPTSSELHSSIFQSQWLGENTENLSSLINLDPIMDLVGNVKDAKTTEVTTAEKSTTVTTKTTETTTVGITETEITTTSPSTTQTTDSQPSVTDHSKIRFIEDTTFPTGLESIFTTDRKAEQPTSSEVFRMPSFPPDLHMFTDSLNPFAFETTNPPIITDIAPGVSESTTSNVPRKGKTTGSAPPAIRSDTTAKTPPPPPIVPADDTTLETSGQFVPVSVIENIQNDGRADVAHDPHDKTHQDDHFKFFNKTQEEDSEQLDKDTITVIVIGSIIGVVIFIAIIVILVTFLKARKGSGELPDVNEKDLEMNGSTKGIDNPLIQLEQETNASFPPPNAEDSSGKPNGHASSEPSSSTVREDMNSKTDSIELDQNDSIADTGGKSVAL